MMAQVSKEREMHCKDENLNMPKERKIGSTETSNVFAMFPPDST